MLLEYYAIQRLQDPVGRPELQNFLLKSEKFVTPVQLFPADFLFYLFLPCECYFQQGFMTSLRRNNKYDDMTQSMKTYSVRAAVVIL